MKTKLKRVLLTAVALGAVCSVHAQKLVIKGSDTLGAKLVPMLAEEYRATNKQVLFEIAAEGSSTGIAAIIEGSADIGMSSRRAKPTEIAAAAAKGVQMKPTVVAYDGIAVVVNKANPVSKLTRRQIEQIFTGDVTDWSSVGGSPGGISLYTRNTASGTYADWQEMAMRKRDYAKSSQKMAGNEQIIAEVARNPAGIGYVGLAYTTAPGVKVVAIDGHVPTKAEVLAKRYPFARPTFYYTNGDPTGEAGKFVEFTLGKQGQAIVEKTGFVPVK
jgi:phosphate transport system substrate-binding protein